MSSRFSWIVFSLCIAATADAGLAIAKPSPALMTDATVAPLAPSVEISPEPVAAGNIVADHPAIDNQPGVDNQAISATTTAKLPRKASYRVDLAQDIAQVDVAAIEPATGQRRQTGQVTPIDPASPATAAVGTETELEANPVEANPTAEVLRSQATTDEPTRDPAAAVDATAVFDVTLPTSDELEGESRQIVESMRANPNPLLYPTATEEVDIIGNQPLTLDQAYAIAAQNHRDLEVVQLQLEQARLARREQEAQNLPSLAVSGGLTGTENNQDDIVGNPIFGQESFEFDDVNLDLTGTVQLSYDVFTAGRRPALIEAAEQQIRLTELEVERLQETVRQEVATAYYDLQEADELVRINEAFLTEARQSQRDAQIREEAGVGTRFDVLQADVEVANAQQNVTNARSNQIIARRQLSEILNVPHTVTLQATAVVPAEMAWPLSLAESLILAFQNRAELEQVLVNRDLGEQQRRLSLSTTGPQVEVFAQYSISDSLNNNSPGNQDFIDQYRFGAQLNWTLFDGGAARAAAAQNEKDIEIAETQFAQTLDDIRFQVEQSYYGQLSQFANIDTAELAVNQAAEALRIARLRFQAGVGTQLEVIQAQSDLTQAEANRVTAIVGYNRAIANLRRAISNLPESRLLPSLEIPPISRFTVPVNLSDYETLLERFN